MKRYAIHIAGLVSLNDMLRVQRKGRSRTLQGPTRFGKRLPNGTAVWEVD